LAAARRARLSPWTHRSTSVRSSASIGPDWDRAIELGIDVAQLERNRVLGEANTTQFLGVSCKVISLDHLIRVKESLGRPKDLQVVAELRAIRDRLRNPPRPRGG
jgi:hypothetical protein